MLFKTIWNGWFLISFGKYYNILIYDNDDKSQMYRSSFNLLDDMFFLIKFFL